MHRDTFALGQMKMTETWYEAVKRRETNVESYIATRHQAYLERWREAGRFIPNRAKVLDVGGGNLFPLLMEYIKSKNIDYYYLDVDQTAVIGARTLGSNFGIPENHFTSGFNDEFEFENDEFNCVFSSHCIEHSIDLSKTFSELNRIIKPNGFLLMAVPIGWEENPQHPYFFNPDQWIALVTDAGFQIRTAQIGREYPEQGYDFFIAAKKVATALNIPRIIADDYRKENYKFLSHDSKHFKYAGNKQLTPQGDAAHLRGEDWCIEIDLPNDTHEVLPVLLHHEWSGIVQIVDLGGTSFSYDLFSWFPYAQPSPKLIIKKDLTKCNVFIKPVGRNSVAKGWEAIIYGVLYR